MDRPAKRRCLQPDPDLSGTTSSSDLGPEQSAVPCLPEVAVSEAAASSVGDNQVCVEPLVFLQSGLGTLVYSWWYDGLLPSVTIRQGLGEQVLEAFQAQRRLLQAFPK